MLKNKLDYKLVNCTLVMLIIFLLYKTGGLWGGIIGKVWEIILPFLVSFAIAYALYPVVKFLTDHKVPKAVAIILVLILVIGILALFTALVFPLLFSQLGSLF